MDGGAWWAAVHGVAKSRTHLSNFTLTFHSHALEKEMATHSRILAWIIPGMGEPGGLLSMGLHRVGHDWSDLVAAAASCDSFNNITVYFSTILYVILSFFLHVGCFPAMAYLVHFCLCLLKEIPLQWVFFLKKKFYLWSQQTHQHFQINYDLKWSLWLVYYGWHFSLMLLISTILNVTVKVVRGCIKEQYKLKITM